MGTSVPTLVNSNAFYSTPISNSTYIGTYGSIYVKSSMLNAFKTAQTWSAFSNRIVGI